MTMYLTWKRTGILLALIICLGFGLRIYNLGNNSFVADEFLDMNSAYGYFKTGTWKAWDFNHEQPSRVNTNDARDERAVVYKWQVAQVFRFVSPTEAAARSVSVLWGIVTLLVVFWSTLVLTGRREMALVATFLCAVSVAGIMFDRRLRMYAMFTPVYLALATTVYLALEKKVHPRWLWLRRWSTRLGLHPGYALLAAGLFGVSLVTHQLTGVLVFSVAAYLMVRCWQEYRTTRSIRNAYAAFLIIAAVTLCALRVIAPAFVASFTAGLVLFDTHLSYFGYVMEDYAHPLLALFFMGFGAWVLARHERKPEVAWYLALSLLVPFVLALWFFHRNAGPQYIFFAQSFGLILVAAGVFGLWERVRARFSEWPRTGALLVLFGLILLVPNYGFFFEENNTYHETSSGGNPNYRKVFDYFKKNREAGDVLVTRNFRNYYWSGAQVTVYDLGDEIHRTKLSGADLARIVAENKSGWVILSTNDYDYFSNEAETLMKQTMERVSNPSVRGPIEVYRWGRAAE